MFKVDEKMIGVNYGVILEQQLFDPERNWHGSHLCWSGSLSTAERKRMSHAGGGRQKD